jgi:hypothetical protein
MEKHYAVNRQQTQLNSRIIGPGFGNRARSNRASLKEWHNLCCSWLCVTLFGSPRQALRCHSRHACHAILVITEGGVTATERTCHVNWRYVWTDAVTMVTHGPVKTRFRKLVFNQVILKIERSMKLNTACPREGGTGSLYSIPQTIGPGLRWVTRMTSQRRACKKRIFIYVIHSFIYLFPRYSILLYNFHGIENNRLFLSLPCSLFKCRVFLLYLQQIL